MVCIVHTVVCVCLSEGLTVSGEDRRPEVCAGGIVRQPQRRHLPRCPLNPVFDRLNLGRHTAHRRRAVVGPRIAAVEINRGDNILQVQPQLIR